MDLEKVTSLNDLIERTAREVAVENGRDISTLRPSQAQLMEMRGLHDTPTRVPGTKGFGKKVSPRQELFNFLANDKIGQKAASGLATVMAKHAKKKGLRVGFRDIAAAATAWFQDKPVVEEVEGLEERLSTFTGGKSPAEIVKDPGFKWAAGEVPTLEASVKELKRRFAGKKHTGGSLNQIANLLRGLEMTVRSMSGEVNKVMGWKK